MLTIRRLLAAVDRPAAQYGRLAHAPLVSLHRMTAARRIVWRDRALLWQLKQVFLRECESTAPGSERDIEIHLCVDPLDAMRSGAVPEPWTYRRFFNPQH